MEDPDQTCIHRSIIGHYSNLHCHDRCEYLHPSAAILGLLHTSMFSTWKFALHPGRLEEGSERPTSLMPRRYWCIACAGERHIEVGTSLRLKLYYVKSCLRMKLVVRG